LGAAGLTGFLKESAFRTAFFGFLTTTLLAASFMTSFWTSSIFFETSGTTVVDSEASLSLRLLTRRQTEAIRIDSLF
jgi:uncharacterized membrane protein